MTIMGDFFVTTISSPRCNNEPV